MGELLTTPSETPSTAPPSDGERSRAAILDAATQLATVEGLDGLSIGRLAEHTGMSKSGLYAHFGSKEELQLATIDAASEIFVREVIEPARRPRAPRGSTRSRRLPLVPRAKGLPRRVFFAAAQAELDTHPGPVREKLRETSRRWFDYVERQVRGAQEMGELRADEDPAQLAFEIDAMLKMATAVFVLHDDAEALERARRGVETRVERAKIGA